MSTNNEITGFILAGGKSSRMGEDKSWVVLPANVKRNEKGNNNDCLISIVIQKITKQVSTLCINANKNIPKYKNLVDNIGLEIEVFTDRDKNYKGPLAGILTAMENAKTDLIFTTTLDCPFIPDNIVSVLRTKMVAGVDIVCAKNKGRHQPLIAIWRVCLKNDLEKFLDKQNNFKVDSFTDGYNRVIVDFNSTDDIFFNINTRQDLDKIGKI